MTDRPILFSAPMVRAILDGSKTQTRRVVKPQPVDRGGGSLSISYAAGKMNHMGPAGFMLEKLAQYGCPYGKTGDRLWVREKFTIVPVTAYRMSEGVQQTVSPSEPDYAAVYAAGWDRCIPRWKPSIHMPRWASRIMLEITSVRVERLQDISDEDALEEGVTETEFYENAERKVSAGAPWPAERLAFADLWKSINGPESWGSNPWVWVIGFKRVDDGKAGE